MKIEILKKSAGKKTVELPNGDKYDGIACIYNDSNTLIFECVCNTDPTIGYNGGEIAAGEYIYKKRVRVDGKVVFDIFDKQTKSNTVKSKKANPNHGGKKIMQAVQIHSGGVSWDGSHGCITIHPRDWLTFRQLAGDGGDLIIKENNEKEEGSANA